MEFWDAMGIRAIVYLMVPGSEAARHLPFIDSCVQEALSEKRREDGDAGRLQGRTMSGQINALWMATTGTDARRGAAAEAWEPVSFVTSWDTWCLAS